MNRSRLIFEFCRTYDGSEPAARWLKRLEFDLRGLDKSDISPKQYLSSVDLLLMGEAADWTESSPEISTILAGSHIKKSLQRFLMLFKERFPSKAFEAVIISFPEVLETIRQTDESLSSYYQRTIQITSRYGVRDRLSGGPPLSILESSALNIIYDAFLRGLTDRELRCEAARRNVDGRSLHAAFVAMEEAYKSRVFLRKIEFEEVQTREALFYKNVVKKNVSISQLESMWTSYKAGDEVPEQRVPQQFLLPSPKPSQESRPAIESKSVTWSVDPPKVRRSILRPGSRYGYGAVGAGSVVASAAGYGPASDQGVG